MNTAVQTEKNAEVSERKAQAASRQENSQAIVPRVDVLEDDKGITLLADLPGVGKDHLDLKVDGDTLLIEGEVTPQTPDGLEPVYAEVRVPRYRRSFVLSRELDLAHIEANLKDGVLALRIPKQEHAQPRRIQIQTG